jgi:hypothetical protein
MLLRSALAVFTTWVLLLAPISNQGFGQDSLPATMPIGTKRSQQGSDSAPAQKSSSKTSKTKQAKKNWPSQELLTGELQELAKFQPLGRWSDEMSQLLELLHSTHTVDDNRAHFTLEQISQKLTELPGLAGELSQANLSPEQIAETNSQIQRLWYKFDRRLAIWKLLHQHAVAQANAPAKPQWAQTVAAKRVSLDHVHPQWIEYLALDEVQTAFHSLAPNPDAQREAARKALGRINSPALDESQKSYIDQAISPSTLTLLRQAASDEVDHYKLLALMEHYEKTGGSGVAAHHLNDQYQNLLWADDPLSRNIANQIQAHYRNGNVRIAINQQFINQLVPQTPATTEPISENVMGARISGQNHIQNQVRISLIENPNNIDLRFETVGQVDSQTSARKSGFTIQNHSKANFQVFKRLAFSRTGVISGSPSAFSEAKQRLVGLRGQHDRVPILGWLARRVAQQKVAEQTPQAEQMVEERIESTAKDRMQVLVDREVNRLRHALNDRVVQPLISLGLEPDPIQMSTTLDRIVTRYRLAGRDQMGAHTSRPTDFNNDLVSIQVHQSAINNLIERFELNGKEFTAETLRDHLENVVGVVDKNVESTTEADFKFADYDAMRIDFREGEITVEIKLSRLQIGKGKKWRRITIGTTYVPEYIGTKMVLTQKDGIELDGKNLKLGDEMAIRTACKVILDDQYSVDLIPPSIAQNAPNGALHNLIIDRLSISDGWFGVAFNQPMITDMSAPIIYQTSPQQQPQTIIYDQAYLRDGSFDGGGNLQSR